MGQDGTWTGLGWDGTGDGTGTGRGARQLLLCCIRKLITDASQWVISEKLPNFLKLSQFSDQRPKKIKNVTEFPMVSCLGIKVAMIRRVWVRPARQVIIPSHTSYHLNHKSATTTHVLSIMPDIHYILILTTIID